MNSRVDSNEESRTSSVGTKRSSNSSAARKRKRRRRDPQESREESSLVGSSFVALSDHSQMPDDQASTDYTDSLSQPSQALTMATGLGKNRLASGFVRRPAITTDPVENNSTSNPSPGESADSPIEISSDDEMADSEGGMVINLQGQQTNHDAAMVTNGDNSDVESGEYTSSSIQKLDSSEQDGVAPKNTVNNSQKLRRLADLDEEQLEDQLRYALYHLDRDQVDLNRPVVCLQCSVEGHLGSDCPDTFTAQSPFPIFKIKPGAHIKLWISCCVCASKSHLIGDCPQAERAKAARWSLASLDPNQVTNLSLEKGIGKLETEAENRGIRPAGLQIRGRAGRHTAGHGARFQESSEEEFLPSRRADMKRSALDPSTRYDRFNAPSDPSANRARSGGAWYGTDSFGRRRSRSPETDQRSARGRQVPSSRDNQNFQPRSKKNTDTYRPRGASPARRNIQIQLPARPNFDKSK